MYLKIKRNIGISILILLVLAILVSGKHAKEYREDADAAENAPILPHFECVHILTQNYYTAYFGYDNQNTTTFTIPIGKNNSLSPEPVNQYPQTVFEPGRHYNDFCINVQNNNQTWTLKGPDGKKNTVFARKNSPSCSTLPYVCQADVDSDSIYDVLEIEIGADPMLGDSDSDGILDGFEAPNCVGVENCTPSDTDEDGIPDIADGDDDGDGILTINEQCDPNGDGNPDDAIDSDLDGIPDYLDDTDNPPVCGNGTLETGETCDDGNASDGDGCSSTCQTENGGSDHTVSGTQANIVFQDESGNPITQTSLAVYLWDLVNLNSYLELSDDLDTSSYVIGSNATKSWFHFGDADRSSIIRLLLIFPRESGHIYARVCPGAMSASEIYNGCFGEIRLTPVNPSQGGYSLIHLDDLDYWYVEADTISLFSTGGEGVSKQQISHWPLNEGSGVAATDVIGPNNGTLNGPIWDTGIENGGLHFDGNDDRVVVPDNDSLDLTDSGTIQAWINADTFSQYAGIVHKGDKSNFSDEAYTLQFWNPLGTIRFAIFDREDHYLAIDSIEPLQAGQWYHIVATWDATSLKLFINGELDRTIPNTIGTVWTTDGDLMIGAQLDAPYSSLGYLGFDGLIDEVALFNYALPDQQILDLYNDFANPGGPSCSTVFTDNFEDGDTSDWFHTWDTGANWTVQNNGTGFVYNHNGSVYSQTQPAAIGVSDYVYTGTMKLNQYGRSGIMFRYTDDDNFWRLVFEEGQARLRGQVNGSWTNTYGKSQVPFAPVVGTTYHLKVQAHGAQLRARWWADGDAEPTEWFLYAEDARNSTGGIGLASQNNADFDNLAVSTCLEDETAHAYITVLSPNGGEELAVGSNVNVRWESFGTSGTVTVQYSTDNFTNDINTISSVSDTGTYAWTLPVNAASFVSLRVLDTIDPLLQDISNASFSIIPACTDVDGDSICDPVALWHLDQCSGTVILDSAGTHEGTVTNGLWRKGYVNQGMLFDGINDQSIIVPHSDDLNVGNYELSVSFWIKADRPQGAGYANVLYKHYGYTGNGYNNWLIRQHNTSDTLEFAYSDHAGLSLIYAEKDILDDEWHHVAYVIRPGVSHNIFVDGQLDKTAPLIGFGAQNGTNPMKIGGTIGSGHALFPGKLDEIAIYNYGLEAGEVTVLAAVLPDPHICLVDSDSDGLYDEIEEEIGSNPLSTDTDGDGVLDNFEAPACQLQTTCVPTDTDSDGLPDIIDPDDDNDGRPSSVEGNDPNHDGDPSDAIDRDLDGVPNYLDLYDMQSNRITGITMSIVGITGVSGSVLGTHDSTSHHAGKNYEEKPVVPEETFEETPTELEEDESDEVYTSGEVLGTSSLSADSAKNPESSVGTTTTSTPEETVPETESMLLAEPMEFRENLALVALPRDISQPAGNESDNFTTTNDTQDSTKNALTYVDAEGNARSIETYAPPATPEGIVTEEFALNESELLPVVEEFDEQTRAGEETVDDVPSDQPEMLDSETVSETVLESDSDEVEILGEDVLAETMTDVWVPDTGVPSYESTMDEFLPDIEPMQVPQDTTSKPPVSPMTFGTIAVLVLAGGLVTGLILVMGALLVGGMHSPVVKTTKRTALKKETRSKEIDRKKANSEQT